MGVYKYPPKHNNPNWSQFSARKKRYDYANKSMKSSSPPNKKQETASNPQPPLKRVSFTVY